MKRHVDILGVGVDSLTWGEMLARTEGSVRNGGRNIFASVNVNAVNLSQRLAWMRDFFNNAEIAYADGQGIRLAAWILGRPLKAVIPLTRWVWELCRLCEEKAFSIFLLGTTEDILGEVRRVLSLRFPRLNVAGIHHGFFPKEGPENEAVLSLINTAHPDILLVGFGMPVQEEWIAKNIERLNIKIAFDAGACFDFMAGVKRACPPWLSRIGLEWLFRLLHEPRRLFKRYFVGNPKFLINVIAQRLRARHDDHP